MEMPHTNMLMNPPGLPPPGRRKGKGRSGRSWNLRRAGGSNASVARING